MGKGIKSRLGNSTLRGISMDFHSKFTTYGEKRVIKRKDLWDGFYETREDAIGDDDFVLCISDLYIPEDFLHLYETEGLPRVKYNHISIGFPTAGDFSDIMSDPDLDRMPKAFLIFYTDLSDQFFYTNGEKGMGIYRRTGNAGEESAFISPSFTDLFIRGIGTEQLGYDESN